MDLFAQPVSRVAGQEVVSVGKKEGMEGGTKP